MKQQVSPAVVVIVIVVVVLIVGLIGWKVMAGKSGGSDDEAPILPASESGMGETPEMDGDAAMPMGGGGGTGGS